MIRILLATLMLLALPATAHAATSECQSTVSHPRWCAKVTIFGHRGEEGANEDTLVALRHDARWNVSFEADQWNLRDDTPVVMHDVTLRRTVDPASMPPGVTPDSRPGDLTIEQWRQLRTFGGEPLPTLYQWIKYAQRWGVPGMVEIKYGLVHPERVASWVHSDITFYTTPHLYQEKCHRETARTMLDLGMTVGLKDTGPCPTTLEEADAFGYTYVITSPSKLTSAYVRQAHALGLKVGPFLASTRSAWTRLVSTRVDYLIVPHVRKAVRWQ